MRSLQTDDRLTGSSLVKVFARLLGEAARSRARSPRRRPQTAKSPYRRFLFAALRSKVCFSLCAYMVKEKAAKETFAIFGREMSLFHSHHLTIHPFGPNQNA